MSDLSLNGQPDPLWERWLELSRVRAEEQDHEVPPWQSTNGRVRTAWLDLTQPGNLAALEVWGAALGEMNPVAAEASQKAIEVCRERSSGQAG